MREIERDRERQRETERDKLEPYRRTQIAISRAPVRAKNFLEVHIRNPRQEQGGS